MAGSDAQNIIIWWRVEPVMIPTLLLPSARVYP